MPGVRSGQVDRRTAGFVVGRLNADYEIPCSRPLFFDLENRETLGATSERLALVHLGHAERTARVPDGQEFPYGQNIQPDRKLSTLLVLQTCICT